MASSKLFPQHDIATNDVNTSKLNKISSYKSLIEAEMRTRNAGPQIHSMQTIDRNNALNTPKYSNHPLNKSQFSAGSRYESLSPQAHQDLDRSSKIKESQKKVVFRDFSLPVHHGKGSRDKNVEVQKEKVDIISNHVQTTLKQVE